MIEIHGQPLPCVPCHSKFPGRNLTEICNELLPHLQADTTTDEAVFFVLDDTDESVEPDKQCSLYNHEVLFKGSCKRLLDNSSCPDGQWLVLVKETPMCVEQPCPFGQIIYNGYCVDGRDSTVCGTNQILTTFHDGSADCECDEKFATEFETGECHFRQIQGPCVEHWYIEKRIDNQAVCVPNLCMKDAFIYFRGECLQKNYTEFCEPENVHIANDTTVTCTKPLQDVLSAGSLLSFPTGERKTPSGRCRKIFIVKQRSSNFIHPYLKL